MRIQNQKILVTGGNNGIGLELTSEFLRLGASVLVVGQNEKRLRQVEEDGKGRVIAYRCDLASGEARHQLVDRIKKDHPDISILINNAGVQKPMNFKKMPFNAVQEDISREIHINLEAVVHFSLAFLPVLQARNEAAIVNITSGLALAPKKSSPVYCATKSAVRSFSKALRYQCEDHFPKIRVVEALPPLVDTDMTRGRGKNKMLPSAAAREIVEGLVRGRTEIYVGKSKLLRFVMRISPGVGERIMRDW